MWYQQFCGCGATSISDGIIEIVGMLQRWCRALWRTLRRWQERWVHFFNKILLMEGEKKTKTCVWFVKNTQIISNILLLPFSLNIVQVFFSVFLPETAFISRWLYLSDLNLNDKSCIFFCCCCKNITKMIRFAMEIEGIFYVAEVNILMILII